MTTTTNATSIFDHPWINGLGGLSHGSFFFSVGDGDDAVDVAPSSSSRSGSTSSQHQQQQQKDVSTSYRDILTFRSFLYSPNLTWLIMAAVVWQIYPYPLLLSLDEESIFQWQDFFRRRLAFNVLLAFGYIGFWHVTLYGLHWCHRPFVANRQYKVQKVWHNIFYTTLGIVHWTATETAFVYCYRTGRLPLPPQSQIVDSTSNNNNNNDTFFVVLEVLGALAMAMWTPSFRDIHFYLSHRLIHVRWLYKYIHAVHHRNIDVEPFSGLAMHPVEHLWYYSCYAPFLVLPHMVPVVSTTSRYTPFLLYWMGFHTALSPAAAHSGWEDHFSADLMHYLHHRYCDCNYAAGINFDIYFGTYQASIKKGSSSGKQNSTSNDNAKLQKESFSQQPVLDSKATLEGWWRPEHPEYQLGLVVLTGASLWAYSQSLVSALVTASVITIGPAIWALVLAVASRPKSLSWRKTLLAPFDKDPWWSLTLHFGLGVVLGVLPSTYLLYLVLS